MGGAARHERRLTSEESAVEESEDGEGIAQVANGAAAVGSIECPGACAQLDFGGDREHTVDNSAVDVPSSFTSWG